MILCDGCRERLPNMHSPHAVGIFPQEGAGKAECDFSLHLCTKCLKSLGDTIRRVVSELRKRGEDKAEGAKIGTGF